MTMAMKWMTAAAALLLCVDAAPSHAQLKNENLLFSPPTGFKVGFQDSRNGVRLQEWVPSNETVQDWSEMVTVQIFINRGDLDPAKVLGDIAQRWGTACKGSTGEAAGRRQPLPGSTRRPRVSRAGQASADEGLSGDDERLRHASARSSLSRADANRQKVGKGAYAGPP